MRAAMQVRASSIFREFGVHIRGVIIVLSDVDHSGRSLDQEIVFANVVSTGSLYRRQILLKSGDGAIVIAHVFVHGCATEDPCFE